MSGYDPDFLDGIHLPLPTLSPEIHSHALALEGTAQAQTVVNYVNYSLVMSRLSQRRAPLFVALNIDQNQYQATVRGDDWKIDDRVGAEHQLDNDYYTSNPWDRGHMARRASAAWGATKRAAQRADDETFYYTNATLQHANLNRDEWLGLEDWVHALDLDADDRITSFSGPIYGDFDRVVKPAGRELALIPAGFFKVVCFKNRESGQLDVRAFAMYQDEEAIRDRRGRQRYNNQTYQVTVTEIEELTGLVFDDRIYDANPLIHSVADETAAGAPITPERIEVGAPHEIFNPGDPRQTIKDDIVDVFIAAAMVNPEGADRDKEWISLINFSDRLQNLSDWTLEDNSTRRLRIGDVLSPEQAALKPGESAVVGPVRPLELANSGDVIRLYDGDNARIDWVNYTGLMVRPGEPVLFLSPRDTLE